MKKILFTLLLVFCCTIACAQKKSEVLDKLKETVNEFFMPDFNEAVEDSEWRANGLASASSVYIEPNHFFRNGKVCTSYSDWVNRYCSQSLHGKFIEHRLTLSEKIQKVSGNNDLYSVEATLTRSWAAEEGPAIPNEKLKITFLWRGSDKLVHIMHLDGDISTEKLHEPVKPPVTDNKPASAGNVTTHVPVNEDNPDFVYAIEDIFNFTKKDYIILFLCWLGAVVVIALQIMREGPVEWGNASYWKRTISKAMLFSTVFYILLLVGALGYNLYEGEFSGTKVKKEIIQNYDSYRLAAPGKAIAVSKGGKWGLIDFAGNETCPLVLDSITVVSAHWAIAHSGDKLALIPVQHNVHDFHWASYISPIVNGKAIIEYSIGQELPAYCLFDANVPDSSAWKKFPYKYIYFDQPELNRYYFRDENGVCGLMDGEGNVIVEPTLSGWDYFSMGLARVHDIDNNWGFIDLDGKEVVPLKYGYASWFSEGMVQVQKNRMHGFCDANGKEVIPLKYKNAIGFHEGWAAVQNEEGLWGYVDKQGNLVIPHKFKGAGSFHEGLAEVRDESRLSGFIDRTGKVVIPFKYDACSYFSDGMAMVRNEKGHYGYINKAGELAIPYKFIIASRFKDGQAKVWYSNKRWGIIDKQGKLISSNQ